MARRFTQFRSGPAALLMTLVLLYGGAILADLGNLFEVETNDLSNLHFDGVGIQDWDNALIATSDPNAIVANGTPPSAVDNPALVGEAILFYDHISSSNLTDLNLFTTGSKETSPSLDENGDDDPVDGVTDWDLTEGNVPPNKDDISTVYIWHDAPLDNVVFGMERLNNLGDSHLDFGIDHRSWVPCHHDASELCPQRTAGDLVLAYDLSNGGSITTLRVFVWEIPGDGEQVGPTDGCDGQLPGSGGNLSKSCIDGKSGANRYGWEEIALDPGVAIHGTNANPIPAGPWGSFGQGGARRTEIPSRGFFESYVNLEALGFEPLCSGAATLSVRSRSSSSIDSELKDLAGPIDLGGGDIVVSAEVTGSCALTFDYSASAEDLNGDPIDPNGLVCEWDCVASDPNRLVSFDPDVCSGSGSVAEGDGQPVTIDCTVHVVQAELECSGDGEGGDDVFTPLEITIAATPNSRSCSVPGSPGTDLGDIGQGILFTPTISGGSGVNTVLSWTVNGPSNALCSINDPTCTIDIPDGAFCARTNVQAHVDDDICEGADSNVMHVQKQTTETAGNGS